VALNDTVLDYCERLGPGLLAEPLNALSNLAFFYVALRLWQSSRLLARGDAAHAGLAPMQAVLALLLACVGAGSLAFHTLATVWAGLLDVVFIGVFNVAYLIVFLRWVGRWKWRAAGAGGLAFVVVNQLAGQWLPTGLLNGSLLYLPAALVLVGLTGWALRAAPAAGRQMAAAAGVFGLSLLLRTLDRPLCGEWPWGLHFAWHLLNAWVLYRLATALERAPPERRPASPGNPG